MKRAKDMSKLHENKESTMEEGRETKMEKKGYKETESGKMVKSAKGGMTKSQKKIGKVMREFKAGKLHSGKSKKVVKNPKQAIAIALSEAGKSKKMKARFGAMVGSADRLTESDINEAGLSPSETISDYKESYPKPSQQLQEPDRFTESDIKRSKSIVEKGKDLYKNLKETVKRDPGVMGTGDPRRMKNMTTRKGGGIAIAGMGAAYKSGGSVQARGVKLARTRPTKLY